MVAETVLLKALGVACDELAVSDDTLGLLRSVFDSPLQEQQLKAIAAIFGKTVPTQPVGTTGVGGYGDCVGRIVPRY